MNDHGLTISLQCFWTYSGCWTWPTKWGTWRKGWSALPEADRNGAGLKHTNVSLGISLINQLLLLSAVLQNSPLSRPPSVLWMEQSFVWNKSCHKYWYVGLQQIQYWDNCPIISVDCLLSRRSMQTEEADAKSWVLFTKPKSCCLHLAFVATSFVARKQGHGQFCVWGKWDKTSSPSCTWGRIAIMEIRTHRIKLKLMKNLWMVQSACWNKKPYIKHFIHMNMHWAFYTEKSAKMLLMSDLNTWLRATASGMAVASNIKSATI